MNTKLYQVRVLTRRNGAIGAREWRSAEIMASNEREARDLAMDKMHALGFEVSGTAVLRGGMYRNDLDESN